MNAVLEKNAGSVDAIDQLIELHDQANAQLKGFRDTHRQMMSLAGQMFTPGGFTSSAPTAAPVSAPAAKSTPAPAASATTKETSKENSKENSISLKEAVKQVLSRKEHKKGLRVAQIIEIIDGEKLWTTDKDLSNMVHTTVYGLKEKGELVRGEDKTYAMK